MIILFQNILFSREFLAYNICFGLLTKIKKGSGTRSWCTSSAWFFHKDVPYLILYLWTKFQCHTFFPSKKNQDNIFFLQKDFTHTKSTKCKASNFHPLKSLCAQKTAAFVVSCLLVFGFVGCLLVSVFLCVKSFCK